MIVNILDNFCQFLSNLGIYSKYFSVINTFYFPNNKLKGLNKLYVLL